MNRARKEIWIIAGEASGDLYGARIASEIRRRRPDVVVCGMGGVEMRKAGVELLVDSCELGVIGLIEVLENIFKFIRIFLYLIREAKKRRPLEVILIDYPGFNIRFAKAMSRLSGTSARRCGHGGAETSGSLRDTVANSW